MLVYTTDTVAGMQNCFQKVTAFFLWAGVAQWYSDSLRTGWSRDRIPVGARFSAPVQTGTGAHPASHTVGTGSFSGVKRSERSVDHPPHIAPRLRKSITIPVIHLWEFVVCYRVNFTFTITLTLLDFVATNISGTERKEMTMRCTGC